MPLNCPLIFNTSKKTRRQATNPSSECDSQEKEKKEQKLHENKNTTFLMCKFIPQLLCKMYIQKKIFNKPAHFLKQL